MKTYPILFRHNGENLGTAADPIKVFDPETDAAKLDEKSSFCLSYDDDRLVASNLYKLIDVTLPDWLNPSEWIRKYTEFSYLFSETGREFAATAPESWIRGLLKLSGAERTVAFDLLNTKTFRSEFRASLRAQVESWCAENMTDAGPRYASPFSRGQFAAVAKYVRGFNSEKLYYARRYSESTGI